MTEKRFAIVIGINDYTNKTPLDYGVNDAGEIAKILNERCHFNKEDIHIITSDENKPIKDISGHLEEKYKIISKDFRPHEDSIFFFFAGHGEHHFDTSCLLFHDSYIQIGDIFSRINDFQPKYQCYVIDACQSGGKVLTRGKNNPDIIETYIKNSSGILFMYAACEHQGAKEPSNLKHGLFTYHFLQALNDDSIYDKDGMLTPNRIQDYIAKETSKESRFTQTPVIENRTVGYYPFAFNDKVIDIEEKAELPQENENTDDTVYFPNIPMEVRKEKFEKLKLTLNNLWEDFLEHLNFDDYECESGNTLSLFGHEIEQELTNSIVNESSKEGVEAFGDIFTTIKEKIEPNIFAGMLSSLLASKEPKYRTYNYISLSDVGTHCFSLRVTTKSAYKVSYGITIIPFQAVYGIGLAISSYYLTYTGENNNKIKGPFTSVSAFKIHNMTIDNVKEYVQSDLNYFSGMVDDWNSKQEKRIKQFDSKFK